MKQILMAFAVVVLFAGCLDGPEDEPALASSAQEITKGDIESLGGVCVAIFGEYQCVVCTVHYPGFVYCHYYDCLSANADCTAQSGTDDLALWFEAEKGVLTSPMQAATAAGASTGSMVVVPTTAGAGGSVKFTFDVPAGGRTYYPWARAGAPSSSANAFEFRIDSGGYKLWEPPISGSGWAWSRVADANNPPGASTAIFLAAGTHTLRFYRRDAGTRLDRVLLTTNPAFVPVADSYEAESGSNVPPMVTGSTGLGPTGVSYRWVPNGAGAGGSVDLDIAASVKSDAIYTVWARTNAPSVSDDSFYMSANLGPTALWGLPATSATGWAWSQVRDYNDGKRTVNLALRPDAFLNFLRFERREDGAKLDRIIVTNDPGFVPVDAPPPGNTF